MRCLVTAGPTFESLDAVRRLTNFSTGRLGTELACHLAAIGHPVTLLRGEMAVWSAAGAAAAGVQLVSFRSAGDLQTLLAREADAEVAAAFAKAFDIAFTTANVTALIELAERILQPGGGFLFDGYRADAPANWRAE